MTRRRALAAAVLGILLHAGGCADGPPDLVPVAGTATLDGQPLAFKHVEFVPEPGTPGTGAGGNTRADGGYSLIAVRPGALADTPGVPPGSYRVVVTEPLFPVAAAEPAAPPDPAAPAEAAPAIGHPDDGPRGKPDRRAAGPRQAVPAVYTKAETTPLRVEVPPDGGTFGLTLESKKK